MSPELRPVREVLAALRARLRGVRLVRAVAVIATGVAAALVVSFLLDRFLDLPLAVRAVHLVLVLVGLGALAAWVSRPLRTRVDDLELAQALEDVVPELGDRVASALDFERRLDDPAERESREMMRVVIRQAAAFVQRVSPGVLVDARPAKRAAAIGLGAAVVFVATATVAPSDFSLWVRRGILLQDVDWPRRTHIRVLDFPADAPRIVTHGDDLQVVAEVDGKRPRELLLHYEALEFGDEGEAPSVTETDTRRMFPIEDEDGETGRYSFQFRAISTSFRFWVTGGDDDDEEPVYTVRSLIPPRIASIAGRVTYPAYSSLAPATVREASFDVLEGSQVRLELRANMPLASARMIHENGAVEDLALEGEGDAMTLDLRPFEDVSFHLELTAATGQSNREDEDRFLIRAVPDREPTVRVLFPLGRLYRTPDGIVPVKAVLTDDFGVAAATLDIESEDAVLLSSRLHPPADTADGTPQEATKRIDVYRPLELASLATGDEPAAKPGEVLRLLVRATDNDKQETTAPELTIEVLSPEELERRLAQRQVGLRDQLTQLRTHQRRTLDGIRTLRAALDDRAPDAAERDRGRDLQVDQGRVTNEIDQFLRGIHRVFDAYVLNRLGSIPTIDRLLPLYDEALARPVDDGEEVFPRDLYTRIVEEKRERRLYDPEILGTLLDIMDIGDLTLFDLSPGVYEALRTWSDGDDARPEMLAEAQRRSEELEEKLRELDRRMDRWEDLNEIIELARQIEIRQRELADPLDPGRGDRPRNR
jgi:hypothetical protein